LRVAFAAALACLLPLVVLAAPVITYASAIALEELAISAAAGALLLLFLHRNSKAAKFNIEL
jgi:hypothetical protein